MTDRVQDELTKLRRAQLPDDLWARAHQGPRMASLPPRDPAPRGVGIAAFLVLALVAGLVWSRVGSSDVGDRSLSGGGGPVDVPARGEVAPVFLADGRPAFVVHHEDGSVSVVDGFSSHRAWGVEELNVWCPATRMFVEGAHEAHFDEYGEWAAGPAPGGIATFDFEVTATDAAGDPSSILVGQMRDFSPGGGEGPERPPFCPAGGAGSDAGLIEVTGGYTGETGLVLSHRLDSAKVWGSPAEAVAAAPSGWIAVHGTLLVEPDGFVRLCAEVVGERCKGGAVVRGVDGIGLYLNVTRPDWVSGYEEPQVWLVQVDDGVIDNPAGVPRAGVVGAIEPSQEPPSARAEVK